MTNEFDVLTLFKVNRNHRAISLYSLDIFLTTKGSFT